MGYLRLVMECGLTTGKEDEMDKPICPRCKGYIPNNEKPGEYPGALSRKDNKTEVCSACGQEEAFEDYFAGKYRGGDHYKPWPVESSRKVTA